MISEKIVIKTALVCIAKDEENFLPEWIEYHLKLGFDQIFVYTNDWDFFIPIENVKFIPWPGPGVQSAAYDDFIRTYGELFDYAAFLDVDEFLVLKQNNNVQEFIKENIDSPGGIAINWVFFLDPSHKDKKPQNIEGEISPLKRFKFRSQVTESIKTICKLHPDNLFFPNVHAPYFEINDCNGNKWKGKTHPNVSLASVEKAQINHYYTKSWEEWEKKIERGRADIFWKRNYDEWHNLDSFANALVEDNLAYNFMYNDKKNYTEKKFCVIIDAYPQTEDEQKILLENLKKFKLNNIDVLLTSHHPCTPEIIENSTYFIFEKKNNYHFLDSDILNYNLEGIENPVYLKYIQIGNEMFRHHLVVTGWSVSIVSQFVNSIKFLWAKGYEFAFYFVGDFKCPDNIQQKFSEIFSNLGDHKNYFIKNNPNFSSWYCPHLFGFTLEESLIQKIPNFDFSDNSNFQKIFPNCGLEDVMLKLFGWDNNLVDEYSKMDKFFGFGNWNTVSSIIKPGPSALHFTTTSSIFWKEDLSECSLLLEVDYGFFGEEVKFEIQIENENGELFYKREIILRKGTWYKEKLNDLFVDGDSVIFTKKLQNIEDETCQFTDSIKIKRENLSKYALVKNYYLL